MSIKSNNFKKILHSKYLEKDEKTFIETSKLHQARHAEKLLEVYQILGGKEDFPIISQKGYFFETHKFAISFDDQLCFNKYRVRTLRSDIYLNFNGLKLEKYRSYCSKYERECLKSGSSGNLWTDITSEHHFGKSEASGDLGLNGSAGWKYRAFKNFIEDLYAKCFSIKLLRVSVWDEILINKKLYKMGDLLNTPNNETSEHILKYLERRIINLFA